MKLLSNIKTASKAIICLTVAITALALYSDENLQQNIYSFIGFVTLLFEFIFKLVIYIAVALIIVGLLFILIVLILNTLKEYRKLQEIRKNNKRSNRDVSDVGEGK